MSKVFARVRKYRRSIRWAIPLLLLLGGVGVWQHERLWLSYCASRLESASDEQRSEWGARLARGGDKAVPTLLKCFQHDNPSVCVEAKTALAQISGSWAGDDPRRADFTQRFVALEPRFSTPGRAAALELLPDLLSKNRDGLAEKAKEMVVKVAKSEAVGLRVQAVAFALHPDIDALAAIEPLLRDESPEVRRAAILALGPLREARGQRHRSSGPLLARVGPARRLAPRGRGRRLLRSLHGRRQERDAQAGRAAVIWSDPRSTR